MSTTMSGRRDRAGTGARPTLARLTLIELRKVTDTRAGFWLLVTVAVLQVAVVGLQLASGDGWTRTFGSFVVNAQLPAALLLSVLAVLSVTSEWSQRTALSTFSLVPGRGRIVAAKALAATLLTTAVTATGAAAGAAGFAIGGALDRTVGGWHLSGVVVPQLWLIVWVNTISGTAFGLLLLRSAPAIVTFYAVPLAWSLVGRLVPGLETAAEWLDLSRAHTALLETGVTGEEWAKLLAASGLWVALPAALGMLRVRRTELS